MDIYENTILCKDCNKETEKSYIFKDGFKIRSWICPECENQWFHPSDMQDYERFSKIKNKDFTVKLRLVGNSYAVSIPREIIQYTELKKEGRLVKMSLDEPEKLTLSFTKITRKIFRK